MAKPLTIKIGHGEFTFYKYHPGGNFIDERLWIFTPGSSDLNEIPPQRITVYGLEEIMALRDFLNELLKEEN